MELKDIKKRLNELSASRNDTFSIPVTINGRLTRTLGRVMHMSKDGVTYPTRMEFSRDMLETVVQADIESVIAHEWAHYYITKTTGKNHGHDADFKALCAEIGCFGTTSIKVERTVERKAKYMLYCKECGQLVAEYSRKCKTIDYYELCTSKCCNAGLRLEDNSKK